MHVALWAVLLLVLVLALCGPAAAWAADLCFTDFANDLLVAKNLILPTAGQCKEFNGYFADTAWLLSGSVCGTSDNTKIRFSLRYSAFRTSSAPFVAHVVAYLTRSTMSGQLEYLFPTGASGVFAFAKVPCPAPHPLD